MKKAIIYTRVSTEDQKEHGFSLNDQEARLRKHCKQNNIEVVDHYQDDHSAKDFVRPAYQRMLADIRGKRIKADVFICVRMDRFSRNIHASLDMIKELKSYGIEFRVVEGQYDLSTPENMIPFVLNMLLPEVENIRRGLNTKVGMRQALREGKWMWKAPKGYSNDQQQKMVVPNEDARYILKAFEECAKGVYNNEEIRKSLLKLGFKCSKQQFSNILRNPFYTGKIRINAWKDEEEEIVAGIHTPLICEDLFNTVQNILNRKSKQGQKHTLRNPNLPLRGYMICNTCGGNLTGSASRNRSKTQFYYYHCQKGCKERHPAQEANESFQSYLESFKIPEEVGKLYFKIMEDLFNKDEGEVEERVTTIDKQIEKHKNRINEAEDKLFDGIIDNDAFKRAKNRYDGEIDKMAAERLELIERESNFMKYVKYSFSLLMNLGEYYKLAALEVKQKIVGSIFPEKIIFDGEKYRTTKANEVLNLLTLNINELGRHKKRLNSKIAIQSNWAPPLGLEPRTL